MAVKEKVELTQQEANEILSLLAELPIKYLGIVQAVQRLLAYKFEEIEETPNALHSN